MLGSTTRSDIINDHPDYKNAILTDELDHKLKNFADIFSDIDVHNHIAETYRDAGKIDSFPDDVTKLLPKSMKLTTSLYGGFPFLVGAQVPDQVEKIS